MIDYTYLITWAWALIFLYGTIRVAMLLIEAVRVCRAVKKERPELLPAARTDVIIQSLRFGGIFANLVAGLLVISFAPTPVRAAIVLTLLFASGVFQVLIPEVWLRRH